MSEALAPLAEGEIVEQPATNTPEQAKNDAVANLTMKAYERAGMTPLTPEESAALQADFPDDAFKSGAGGNASLLYIEHAYLRERLTAVLGMGQWALVPRSRWTEDRGDSTRVYVETMLIVRGCYVAEGIGDMDYWPKNRNANYADAVKGATSAALRTCCKEFGIGLQAWRKGWADGWWDRKNGKKTAPVATGQPQTLQEAMQAQDGVGTPNKRIEAEALVALWVKALTGVTQRKRHEDALIKMVPVKEELAANGFDDLIEKIDAAARECEDRVYQPA